MLIKLITPITLITPGIATSAAGCLLTRGHLNIKSRLTVEVNAANRVIRILNKNGKMHLQTIPGYHALYQVSVGLTRKYIVQFYKRHFQLDSGDCSASKQKH